MGWPPCLFFSLHQCALHVQLRVIQLVFGSEGQAPSLVGKLGWGVAHCMTGLGRILKPNLPR